MNKIFFNSFNKVRLIWRFLLFILGIIIISTPLQFVLREFLDEGLLRGNLSMLIMFISTIASLYIQIKYIDKSSFEKYGLKLGGDWIHEFIVGCLIAAIQLSLFFIAMSFSGNLEVTDYFITNSPDFTFIEGFLSELMRQLGTSISEEIMFRAFLFYIIYEAICIVGKNRTKNAILACIIISPFFGIAHAANEGATIYSTINLGLDGMMICLPFLITGRLGMSVGMHFSWNVVQGAIFGFPNSGHIAKASILNSSMPDNMFTGGTFGPEGSILLLVLDAIAVALIIYWKKFKRYDYWVNPVIIEYDTNTPR